MPSGSLASRSRLFRLLARRDVAWSGVRRSKGNLDRALEEGGWQAEIADPVLGATLLAMALFLVRSKALPTSFRASSSALARVVVASHSQDPTRDLVLRLVAAGARLDVPIAWPATHVCHPAGTPQADSRPPTVLEWWLDQHAPSRSDRPGVLPLGFTQALLADLDFADPHAQAAIEGFIARAGDLPLCRAAVWIQARARAARMDASLPQPEPTKTAPGSRL